MPTPFTHLHFARQILESPDLNPAVREALQSEWPAFLLGNIAPDAQTLSGQLREETHFFPVPLGDAPPAQAVLFSRHPVLARPGSLPPARAAFLAGYLAHLALDVLWIQRIFDPIFGEGQKWGTFRERLYLHNALRAWEDARDLAGLPAPTVAADLRRAEPDGWLSFLGDVHLRAWRDLLADQLGPGGATRTVEVFAARLGADPNEFAALVRSAQAMQQRVFSRLAPDQLAHYRVEGLDCCLVSIQNYWAEALRA